MNTEIPEFARPTTLHSNDPELSKAAEDFDKRNANKLEAHRNGADVGDIFSPVIPEGHFRGEPVIGNNWNSDFNKGIMHGPWQPTEEDLASAAYDGYTEEEGQQLSVAKQTYTAARKNAYPFVKAGEAGQIAETAKDEFYDTLARVGKKIVNTASVDEPESK